MSDHRLYIKLGTIEAAVPPRLSKRARKLIARIDRLVRAHDAILASGESIILDESNLYDFVAKLDELYAVFVRAKACNHQLPDEEI